MSNTATKIQTWVRFNTNNQTESIQTDSGLEVLNEVYHGMFDPDYRITLGGREYRVGRRWPEVYQANDLGVNTTSGTAAYAWLISPVYREEPLVELETAAGSGDYEVIEPARDEAEWTRLKNGSNGRPQRYRRLRSGGAMQIEFAPTPNVTGLDIRLRGEVEVTLFDTTTAADGSTETLFFNESPDRALAYFVSALLKAKRAAEPADMARAHELLRLGLGFLPATTYGPARDDNEVQAHYL